MRLRGANNSDSSREGRSSIASRNLIPSEPLHMTTRAAASRAASVASGSTARSVATASVAASITSNESRRSSLGEITRNVGGSDLDNERPAKIARMSLRDSPIASNKAGPESNTNLVSVIRTHGAQDGLSLEVVHQPDEDFTADGEKISSSENDGQERAKPVSERFLPHRKDSPKPWMNKRFRGLRGKRLDSPFDRGASPGTPSRSFENDLTDRQSPAKHEGGSILDRLPGRRRAPHPDVLVEADLRRQLELKVAYRAVVKALKPVLAELATRTIQDLQTDHEIHKQYTEYETVVAELDARLETRLNFLQAEQDEEEGRLKRMFDANKETLNNNFAQTVRDQRTDCVLQCEYDFLSVWRDAHVQGDGDSTELKDDVIPRLYSTLANGAIVPLAAGCDSRSRFFMETERLWRNFENRHDVGVMLQKYDPASFIRRPRNFAVLDSQRRNVAQAVQNLKLLVDAGEEVEKRASKVIANEDAKGLLALATAIDMVPSRMTPVSNQPPSSTPSSYPRPMSRQQIQANYRISTEPLRTPAIPPLRDVTPTSSLQSPRRGPATTPLPAFQKHIMYGPPQHINQHVSPYPILPPGAQQQHFYNKAPPQQPMANGTHPYYHPYGHPTYTAETPIRHTVPPGAEDNVHVHTARPSTSGGPAPFPEGRPLESQNPDQVLNRQTEPPRPTRRKRPGPRPIYSGYVGPEVAQHLHGGQPWSPFTNTMGPPMYLPKYVKGAPESGRQEQTPGVVPTKSISNQQSPPELNAHQAEHPQEHRRTSSSGSYPKQSTTTSYPPLAPASAQDGPLPPMASNLSLENRNLPPPTDTRPRSSSDTSTNPHLYQTPQYHHQQQPHLQQQNPQPHHSQQQYQQQHQPPPFLQPPPPPLRGASYYYNFPANIPHQPPPQHMSPPAPGPYHGQPIGPQHYTYYPGPPPLPPLPPPNQPLPPPATQQPPHLHAPILPQPQPQTNRSHSRNPSLNSLPPIPPQQSPRPDPFVLAGVGRQLQHHPGQAGHQPILPATLDPSRRPSQHTAISPPAPTATTLTAAVPADPTRRTSQPGFVAGTGGGSGTTSTTLPAQPLSLTHPSPNPAPSTAAAQSVVVSVPPPPATATALPRQTTPQRQHNPGLREWRNYTLPVLAPATTATATPTTAAAGHSSAAGLAMHPAYLGVAAGGSGGGVGAGAGRDGGEGMGADAGAVGLGRGRGRVKKRGGAVARGRGSTGPREWRFESGKRRGVGAKKSMS